MRNLIQEEEENNKPRCNLSLVEKIERLRVLDREIKRLLSVHDELKTEVIDEMGDSKEIIDTLGAVIATLTDQVRNNFDRVAFDLENPGVYDKYINKSHYRVFRLK